MSQDSQSLRPEQHIHERVSLPGDGCYGVREGRRLARPCAVVRERPVAVHRWRQTNVDPISGAGQQR